MDGIFKCGVPGLALLTLAGMLVLSMASEAALSASERTVGSYGDNVVLRGSLDNSRRTFERTHKGNVAFMGGSITEMNGFRPLVCASLQRRFPGTVFHFNNAGVASTCSTTGAFRLNSDVLAQGPVDLLFVEFAVNDDQDAHHTREECIRGMEGIVRRAKLRSPRMDIVIIYFVNPEMLNTYRSGKTPLPIAAHDAVAEHYGIPTVNVAKEVAEEISAGTLTWDAYGGTHPGPAGHALCSGMIDALLDHAWTPPLTARTTVKAHGIPPTELDPLSYTQGRFLDLSAARLKSGWTLGIPDWPHIPGAKRDRFTSVPMLSATEPGAELTVDFNGTAVGAYILAGPDAGIAEASIDGRPFRQVELYHTFSAGLHYPRTVLLGSELPGGRHTLTLRISPSTHSAGHAMRILHFVAN